MDGYIKEISLRKKAKAGIAANGVTLCLPLAFSCLRLIYDLHKSKTIRAESYIAPKVHWVRFLARELHPRYRQPYDAMSFLKET